MAWVWKRQSPLNLDKQEAYLLGMQIWHNECAGKKEGLTSWNEGEEFASMGIGHFIWFPQGHTGNFKETFPALITFMEEQGAIAPSWIKDSKSCPWPTRIKFQQALQNPRMQELREWLFTNVDLQIIFIVNRLQKALPTMIKSLSPKKRKQITNQFYRLAYTPAGLYVLIDYLNFKGEGVSKSENYQGHGWGLLQVLDRMEGSDSGQKAIEEFVDAAKYVLNQRIMHAPPNRKEERWRKGWFNRLDTYLR